MIYKCVKTILETKSGRNVLFEDLVTGRIMTRHSFILRILNGDYTAYYLRNINKFVVPISNPDSYLSNNLK